jgi:hypothetical protein
MKRKLVIVLLALTMALLAAGPATATTWDVYYTFTDPVNPPGPGGSEWTKWTFPASVSIGPSTNIYIGSENIYDPTRYKIGSVDINYNPFDLTVLFYTGNSQAGGATGGSLTPTYAPGYTRADFVIYPQPAWEWAEFVNSGTEPIYIQYMQIDTTCVPLPASLLFLGSGLAACGVWRRCRQTPI